MIKKLKFRGGIAIQEYIKQLNKKYNNNLGFNTNPLVLKDRNVNNYNITDCYYVVCDDLKNEIYPIEIR